MTSDTPAPTPGAPHNTTEPTQTIAAELLTTTALPATTTTAATGPKIPPFQSD
jgi:hypothetical protein